MTDTPQKSESDKLKEKILKEYPRLSADSRFKFRCHKALDCFNACCADVNIALTPYDVLRLRKRLGMGSTEFLATYTIQPFSKDQKLPVVLLRMRDDGKKACHFVGEEGCTVYEDRPWPCRMYPVGIASSKTQQNRAGEEFFFVLDEPHCHGGSEDRVWTIAEWMEDQGVAPYNAMGDLFKEVTLNRRLLEGPALEPRQMEMYFIACYDQDRFRRFVFDSSFLERFDLPADRVERLREDDEELLRFGFEFLRYSLFGEPLMKPRAEAIEAAKAKQAQKKQA